MAKAAVRGVPARPRASKGAKAGRPTAAPDRQAPKRPRPGPRGAALGAGPVWYYARVPPAQPDPRAKAVVTLLSALLVSHTNTSPSRH